MEQRILQYRKQIDEWLTEMEQNVQMDRIQCVRLPDGRTRERDGIPLKDHIHEDQGHRGDLLPRGCVRMDHIQGVQEGEAAHVHQPLQGIESQHPR